jgi:hypothetical protein
MEIISDQFEILVRHELKGCYSAYARSAANVLMCVRSENLPLTERRTFRFPLLTAEGTFQAVS